MSNASNNQTPDREQITEAALKSASILAEAMVEQFERIEPQHAATARQLVAEGGHVSVRFDFATDSANIELLVTSAAGDVHRLGSVPVTIKQPKIN